MTEKVFLQLPEGLKTRATQIVDELEEKGKQVIISGEPCYGACDIRKLPGYKTLHYGHSKMLDTEGVEYVPHRMDQDCRSVALKAAEDLEGTIGLAATIQHSHQLGKVKKDLEKEGREVIIIPPGKKCSEEGQVLGCDFSGAEEVKDQVSGFIFIGTGRFHPLGLAYYTGKPVIRANPVSGKTERMNTERWEKESALRQTKALQAKDFGIVVSKKPGQEKLEQAKKLKEKIQEKRGKAYIILLDEITPEKLLGYKVDAFIITACPRIVIDDWKNYSLPLLLPEELQV